jgi:hypothetical protein
VTCLEVSVPIGVGIAAFVLVFSGHNPQLP